MTPEGNFVAELLARQLEIAEYASDHDGMLEGECTYWEHTCSIDGRTVHPSVMQHERKRLRAEFEAFLDPANWWSAVQLMELADMSEHTIATYCDEVRSRLAGNVTRAMSPERKRKNATGYCGVYRVGNKFYSQVTNSSRHIRKTCGTFATPEEAALARDRVVIEHGWTWTKLNLLTWEGVA